MEFSSELHEKHIHFFCIYESLFEKFTVIIMYSSGFYNITKTSY